MTQDLVIVLNLKNVAFVDGSDEGTPSSELMVVSAFLIPVTVILLNLAKFSLIRFELSIQVILDTVRLLPSCIAAYSGVNV